MSKVKKTAVLMAAWVVLLGALAAVMPAVQEGLAVPWDLVALIMFAPAVAAAPVFLAGRRWWPTPWAGVPTRALVQPVLLALVFVAVFTLVSALLVGASPSLPRTVAGAPLVVFVGLQIAAALGEEIGWRGFMQRLGETVARPGVVTVVLGVLFGATHLGNWPLGAEFMVWFTASSVLMCLGIVTVWRGGFWQRMLPATIIHAGCNLALFSLLDAAQGLPASWLLVVPGGLALLTVAGLRWLSGSVFEQVPDVVGGERTSDPVPALHDVLE